MNGYRSLFDREFRHGEQAAFCARHLEVMREDLGDAWWKLTVAAARDEGGSEPLPPGWTRERITLAKHLIRHASESSNFPTTVDFVTKQAGAHIQAMLDQFPRRRIGALKQWDLFSHEHMVPGSEVLRILTDPGYPHNKGLLAPLLEALSWRALVTGTKRKQEKEGASFELGQLDGDYSKSLPKTIAVFGSQGPAHRHEVPPKYYALMRYDAAGLLPGLVPVSVRAETVVGEYDAYKNRFSLS